jgi:rhamnosyltransferase
LALPERHVDMNGPHPPASVIVRTKDSARTLDHVVSLLRAQTIASEIIVVDSGSRDRTLEIAHRRADLVIEIDRFSFGYALNVGASAATAPIHFALSSHASPPDERWIERSLAKYANESVAATTGVATLPGTRQPLHGTFLQTLAIATSYPLWGFSNTGSSWRADVWRAFPFDEQLSASEDKEWAFRILTAGWTIAFDRALLIESKHRRDHGLRQLYARTKREFEALGSFAQLYAPVPAATMRGFAREWLTDIPEDAPYHGWRRRLNYFRFTELLGKYAGLRAAESFRAQAGCRVADGRPPLPSNDLPTERA